MTLALDLFFDELYATLAGAGLGLHVPGSSGGVRSKAPAPYVELPDIVYGAGGPGLHRIDDLGLTIVFGPGNNAKVFRTALQFASPTGASSIKQVLEAHHWVRAGTVFVARAEPTIEAIQAANPSLAYTFHLQITGG